MRTDNKNSFSAQVVETGITLSLFFVVFWVHTYLTQPILMIYDTMVRWFEVKRLYYGLEFSHLDHHTMRWAINFPVLVTQKIFGTAASTYYLSSSTAVTLAAVLCYKIGRYAGNRIIGLTVLVLFVTHPDIIKSSSQLLPAIFSIAYLLGAVYFCLLYIKRPHQHLFIFISAVFLFCAYGTKITNLYFIPAFIFFLYINSCATGILILLGLLGTGIAIETYWINTLLAEPLALGRLTAVSGHANKMLHSNEGYHSFSDIWTRWAMLSKYAYLHTITAFFASMYFLINRRRNVAGTLLALCFLFFACLITFMVLDLTPITYASGLVTRYLYVMTPLSLLISILAVHRLGNKIYFRTYLFCIFLPT